MISLGIDPSASDPGAAVLLDGTAVLWWGVWSKVVAGFRVRSANRYEHVFPCLNGVSLRIANDVSSFTVRVDGHYVQTFTRIAELRIVVESPIEGRTGMRRGTTTALAEACGELIGPLRHLTDQPILRPVAVERSKSKPPGWRRQVLGLPNTTPADQAEAYAVARAPLLFRWNPDPFAERKLTKGELGALAEAACIAAYLHAYRTDSISRL